MWRKFWKEINTPSDFYADPYGELTNQSAHTLFGMLFACLFCVVALISSGEFPQKETAAVVVTLPYLAGELIEQRWRGSDTVADVFFYAIGGYGILATLTEAQIDGRVYLEPDPQAFLACLAAFCAILLVRIRVRLVQKYG